MGFFKDLLDAAAPVVGGFVGGPVGSAIGGALGGALSNRDNAKAAAQGSTTTQQLDPRIASMLFGESGSSGLLSQFAGYLNQGQSGPVTKYNDTVNNYLTQYSGADTDRVRNAAYQMLNSGGQEAPRVGEYGTNGVAQIATPQVQAPAQNNIDLTGAFNRFISGDTSTNPQLAGALQAGIDATNAGFAKNQTDLTNNLQRNILPSIRGGAIASGQYGGSRQGVAEGLALSDYTNQLTSANTQLGLANSANTTAQQAAAWDRGQDRSLAATLNLSGQQYNTASQNANLGLQAQLANQSADNNMRQFGANMAQNADQANAQLRLQQQQQNNASLATGAGLLSGQLGSALTGATNAQNFGVNRAGQVAGLLSPFIGVNSSSTSTQPYYGSTAGSAIGGALGGLSLYQQFAGMNNPTSGAPSNVLF